MSSRKQSTHIHTCIHTHLADSVRRFRGRSSERPPRRDDGWLGNGRLELRSRRNADGLEGVNNRHFSGNDRDQHAPQLKLTANKSELPASLGKDLLLSRTPIAFGAAAAVVADCRGGDPRVLLLLGEALLRSAAGSSESEEILDVGEEIAAVSRSTFTVTYPPYFHVHLPQILRYGYDIQCK